MPVVKSEVLGHSDRDPCKTSFTEDCKQQTHAHICPQAVMTSGGNITYTIPAKEILQITSLMELKTLCFSQARLNHPSCEGML